MNEILNKIGKLFVFCRHDWLEDLWCMLPQIEQRKREAAWFLTFYRNLEVSGVFEARQQWLQQGVSHLRDAGGL